MQRYQGLLANKCFPQPKNCGNQELLQGTESWQSSQYSTVMIFAVQLFDFEIRIMYYKTDRGEFDWSEFNFRLIIAQ